MRSYFKALLRPSLLAIMSAFFIVYVLAVVIVPFMKRYPVFYQGLETAYLAYTLKFNSNSTSPAIFMVGGSRFVEMTYSNEHVNAQLKKYSTKNFQYINLSSYGLVIAEQLVVIQQTHFAKGSVVLIGVNIREFSKPDLKARRALQRQRLSFLDYKNAEQTLIEAGIPFGNTNQPSVYQSRFWLGDFIAQFKLKTLFTQNWHELLVPYARPNMFGSKISFSMAALERRKNELSYFGQNHKYNRDLIEFIINFSEHEKGYKVYLFQAPAPFATQQLEAPYLSAFQEDLNYLVENTGAQVINANNDVLVNNEFHDLIHLNELGREHYEETFMKQLASVANDNFDEKKGVHIDKSSTALAAVNNTVF